MPSIPPFVSLSERVRSARFFFRTALISLATGGHWAVTQPRETRGSLIWFWFDGFFASASDNIVVNYLVVYLLALGATQSDIGLMSSISSLIAAVILVPGAWMVERIGRRRNIILGAAAWARTALLLLALVPFFFSGVPLVIIAIAFSISRDAMVNLAFPALMSLIGDIVPLEGRGRYFASRNFIMAVTGIAATFLIGQLITRFTGASGYQIALVLAFFLGMGSTYSFSHIIDRHVPISPRSKPTETDSPAPQKRASLLTVIRGMTGQTDFLHFAIVTALWNTSLNFAGPFFTVYLVKNLHADAAMVGYTAIATSVTAMLVQFKLGQLNDRWGARKLTVISGLLIPILPLAWVFSTAAWHVILINLLSGVLWGAYGLGSLNYLLQITPPELRARYSAVFQIIVTVSLGIGAALGSLAINYWGFHGVFIGSAAGRLSAALLFAFLVTRSLRKKARHPAD